MAFHKYPYSDFHELNLDYILNLARESMGIHLEVVGKKLQLKNAAGEVISNVQISYAEMAESDEDGKPIEAYIFNAGLNGRSVVFTHGNNDTTVIPFPEDAITDKNGKDLTTYVARVDVSGTKLRVTDGAGTAYTFTCPYSNAAGKAEQDENGKVLTTYMADVEVSGNNIVFKDGEGVTLKTITVSYAENAGVAEKAAKDPNGNAFVSDYGRNLVVDGNKIGIEAHDGTSLNKITVPFASLSTDATNAIKTVTISGDQLIFTTHGGTQTAITVPYSVRAQKDDLGNNLKSTYVANVTNDPVTGEISFLDAQGHEIVAIVPTVDSAVHDSLGNDITDYVKSILTSANSNFVTVTHGDGTVDSLTINYSTIAWKDTYGNAIGNTYCSLLTMGTDPQDGEPIVIGWNGETPKAEIFRLKVQAVSAQKDGLGNVISEYYAHSLAIPGTEPELILRNGEGDTLSSVDLDQKLRLENLKHVGNATGISNADLLHWKNTGPGTGEWETLGFTNLSNGDVLTWDVTNNTWDAKAPARTTELSDLDDVDTTGVAAGDVLTYDSTDQEWQPKAPFVPNGGYILDYVGTIQDNTLLSTYLQNGFAAGSGVSYALDKATKVVDGTTLSGTISVSDLLKDGNVFVRVSYKYANNAVKKPIFIGQIMEKSGNFFIAYGNDMLTSIRWTGAHSNAEDDIVKIEDDGTFNSFATYAPAYPIKKHATKPIIILTTEPGSGSTGGIPVKRSTSVTPADLWNHLIIGSPMPALYVHSKDPDNVLTTVTTYNELSSFKVTKGSGTDALLLVADIAGLVSQMTSANTVLTLEFIYKNVDDFDGHKYDYEISFTVANVTLNANLNNDFTFSDFTINRTQVS